MSVSAIVILLILGGFLLFFVSAVVGGTAIYRKDGRRGVRALLVLILGVFCVLGGVFLGGAAALTSLGKATFGYLEKADLKDKIETVKKKAQEEIGSGKSDKSGGPGEEYDDFITAGPASQGFGTHVLRIYPHGDLKKNGIRLGRSKWQSKAGAGEVVLYLIFDKQFKGSLLLKAYDSSGLELGRVKRDFNQGAGTAKYEPFALDKNADLSATSTCSLDIIQ